MSGCLLIVFSFFISSSIFADSIIDGGGNKLTLTQTGSLTIPSASKLTLRNLTLKGLKADRLSMINGTSKLVLDNAKVILDGDYTFSQGSIEIINNSSIEGEYNFTFSGHNLLIAKSSRLKVGNGTTFVCTPTSGIKMPIRFENDTSTLLLDNATFKNYSVEFFDSSKPTGMIFTNGNFEIDGASVLDNIGTTTDVALVLGTGPAGDGDCRLHIRPHAKLIVKNAGLVYKNNRSNSFNSSGNLGTIELRDNGKFLVENSSTPVTSFGVNVRSPWDVIGQTTLSLDSNILDFDFSKLSGLSSVTTITSLNNADLVGAAVAPGAATRNLAWSPDGVFLAAGLDAGVANEVQVYRFDATTPLTLLDSDNHARSARWVEFSPDGKFLAVAFGDSGAAGEIRVYRFNPFAASPLDNSGYTSITTTNGAWSATWSPDGRFLSVGILVDASNRELRVFQFDPTLATPLTELTPGIEYGLHNFYSKFSPDGRYIVTGQDITVLGQVSLKAYVFDPTSSTPLQEITTGVVAVPDTGQVNALEISPDGHFVAVVVNNPSTGNDAKIFRFTPENLKDPFGTDGDGIGGVNTGRISQDIRFSPDGLNVVIGLDTGTGGETRMYTFDPTSATPLGAASGLGDGVDNISLRNVEFAPSGRYIAVGEFSDSIRVYEPSRGGTSGLLTVGGGTMNLGQDTELSNIKLKAS